MRKNKTQHAGTFCLSFFMTDENLSLENIALENDIYLYFWILSLKPIVVHNNTYTSFIEAQKTWCDFREYAHILEENKKYITYNGNDFFGTWNIFH
jgi:hypothetical protein